MKACGIIAEYNPFHTGHRHHLLEARRLSGADVIVVALSGSFVQRGEPAIFDKFFRAKQALRNGADIVIEMPTLGSVQAADYFATAGVHLLEEAGCQVLAFGSEEATEETYYQALEQWKQLELVLHKRLKEEKTFKKMSYPKQLATILDAEFSEAKELKLLMQEPNQQLGLAYVKAVGNMNILPIPRKQSHHHHTLIENHEFASGTALRMKIGSAKNTWQEDELLQKLMCLPVSEVTELQLEPCFWQDFWQLLQFSLLRSSTDELRMIYQMNEGIEHRLQSAAKKANSFETFMELVKTKRWTRTKIQRICLYVLLNIRAIDVQQFLEKEAAYRVLGFTKKGQAYLKQLNKPHQFVTNYARIHQNQKYDDLYELVSGKFAKKIILTE